MFNLDQMMRLLIQLKAAYLLVVLLVVIAMPCRAQLVTEWAGSDSCIDCHQDRHDSWYRTYHRTMTQTADSSTVAGRFDGQPLTYWGVTIRPVMRNNQYWFDYYLPDEEEVFTSYQVLRTVGSHRYQQYLTQVEGAADNYYRLHLLWHIQDQRWVHMNGAFLSPDEQGFDDNVALWNHNCIFCHNTGPDPNIQNFEALQKRADQGLTIDLERQSLYRSEVSELGIACETCHGPAARHVKVNGNPVKRMWNKLRGRDSSIINPDRLPQERSVQICGQCHGQRTPADGLLAREWVHNGPVYRAGDDLLETIKLVWRDSSIPGDSNTDRYRLRFWPDDTPRLSAYEYQGILQSRCYLDSEALTCNTCHSMHGGDPEGMTTEWQRGNGPCLECHQEYSDDIAGHTKHAENSVGSECSNCHMPKIVYGVMTIHRSHRIEIPNPQQNTFDQRPNACNQCHLDKSYQWAAAQTARLWQAAPETEQDPTAVAAGIYDLYAGDPVQRAISAWSLQQAIEQGVQQPEWWVSHLLRVMRDDSYPAVRRFAAKALQAAAEKQNNHELILALQGFDFIAAAGDREQAILQLMKNWQQRQQNGWPATLLPEADNQFIDKIELLQSIGRQRSVGISVGE